MLEADGLVGVFEESVGVSVGAFSGELAAVVGPLAAAVER